MKGSPKPPLAERQHGVVTLTQLQSLGLGKGALAKRANDGRLYRVHRGVYVVGRPSLETHGHWMAAVLAYGPRAVLSHRSAAGLQGLRRDTRPRTVTLPSPSARRRAGIDVHASTTLQAADIATVEAIPCTTVARTLVDLGDVTDRRAVERAVDQAELLRLSTAAPSQRRSLAPAHGAAPESCARCSRPSRSPR